MSVFLLDVNMLLALCDPRHLHHDAAHEWFHATGRLGWATCPITENGFIRIASNPTYPNSPGSPPVVEEILRTFCKSAAHRFWPDSISFMDSSLFRPDILISHAQTTDVYLLGLAVKNDGKLATFDGHIPQDAVHGGGVALHAIIA